MGKLGKKARKFAKKHLQSVLKQRRKTKALFKRKAPKDGQNDPEETVDNTAGSINGRSSQLESAEISSLDAAFTENETDEIALASDSDGYLSEDPTCPDVVESETEKTPEDEITTVYSGQNNKIHSDLTALKKKLDTLRKKDPEFSKYLDSVKSSAETIQNDDSCSDEGDSSDEGEHDEDDEAKDKAKFISNQVIVKWCQMVKEDHSQPVLISLLNAYRAACHYGAESVGHRIDNSETFCNILISTLSNVDDAFRGILQFSSSNNKKNAVLKLQKTSKWKNMKPLIKSFVRSTLFLLDQVTDLEILTFALTKIRASLIFFVAFPSLTQRLLKATVHLWATGRRALSSASFLVIRDIAAMFGSDFFNTCLSKTSMSFLSQSIVTEITDIEHMQFLRESIVELCCLDVQKSSLKAVASLSQCAKIFSLGIQTKKKEVVRKICSWEYVNCIDLWVKFISANIRDYNLQSLFFTIVQLINGLAHMFSGPRYLPLRLKCIEWLNSLSSSSGKFIPVASLVLNILEHKVVREGQKGQNPFNISTVLRLPKQYLKSKGFQEEGFHYAIKLIVFHFSQWSYHISFPDLATIPLIRLRKILEVTILESLRRSIRRLIDQVEQNVDFVQKRREDASFSPLDQELADSFLQLEKSNLNTPFTQYYRSILDKACERKLHKFDKKSLPELKTLKKVVAKLKRKPVATDAHVDAEDRSAENGTVINKRRKKALALEAQ